jgi:hypothetical protein
VIVVSLSRSGQTPQSSVHGHQPALAEVLVRGLSARPVQTSLLMFMSFLLRLIGASDAVEESR